MNDTVPVRPAFRRSDHSDPTTGLSRLTVAVADIPTLMREQEGSGLLGIIAFAVPAAPALYRLTPEAARQLRIDVSQRLAGLLRPQDRLYTISHWEWLVVLPRVVSVAAVTLAMMKLRAGFGELPPTTDGTTLLCPVSCGAALYPDDGSDALHLIQSARIACLQAATGGGGLASYDPSMDETDPSLLALHRELRDALSGGPGLALHLQPQVDLDSDRCFGAEALLRWQRGNGEWVPPYHTLAAVERLGLRQTFNRWLLQHAMQIQVDLAAAGVDIVLSLNLSANDLLDPELPDVIGQALATWELPPAGFLLEITETMMVEETRQVMDVLDRLRALGLALAIDDFGTGYAGMSYLQRLPVQEVKIDQSFVREGVRCDRNREIMASIIQLAGRLQLKVIAEGVETEEMCRVVRDLGCHRGQGFLFAPALPAETFVTWWRARHRVPEPA